MTAGSDVGDTERRNCQLYLYNMVSGAIQHERPAYLNMPKGTGALFRTVYIVRGDITMT